MITKKRVFKTFDFDVENNFLSISFIDVFFENSSEVARGKPQRMAFVPGEVEKVKTFANVGDGNPFIQLLNARWTQEVIDAYIAELATNE